MSGQELNLEKNKRGRPAVGRGAQVNIMLRPEIIQALDAAAADNPDLKGRLPLIRHILTDYLVDKGYLPKLD